MNLAILPRYIDRTRVHPRLLQLQRISNACMLASLVFMLGAALVAHTELGRRTVANTIAHVVSDAIPGTMTIGRIETLGWLEPVVDDLRFMDPDGTPVLQAKRAAIELDLTALLHGQLAFHRARIEGGLLLIAKQADGRTGLEATFDDGVASRPDEHDNALQLRLRSIFVDDMTMVFRPSKDRTFRIRNVQGLVSVEHIDTPGARVRLERIAGELETPVAGEHLTIAHADGWVHGKETHVLDLNLETQLGSGYLDGHLAYYDWKLAPVELELDSKSGAAPYVTSLALEAQSSFTDALAVRVR